MIPQPHTIFAFSIIFLAAIASSQNETEADVIAAPSAYAVKDQDGVILTPDEGSSNVYTISAGTTLTFEASALITPESDDDKLLSEWYNSSIPNDDQPNVILSWWWWTSDGKNPAAPEEAPEQTNTPNAPANITKGGLFAITQTFNNVTPEDEPIELTAVFYPGESESTPAAFATVTFFIQVMGPPDVTAPELIVEPADTDLTVGVADRVSFNLIANDPEGNLQAIEWYVEGFDLPLRSNGVDTLNAFLHVPNEDHFNYRFEQTGNFELTVLAYDDFLNANTFKWNIIVREPLLTRSLPYAAEVSAAPGDTKTFQVLANKEDIVIDGVCWQNDEKPPVYIPIADATPQGNLLAFAWDVSFDFEIINDFFETVEVTATTYIEELPGVKTLTENTVTWIVRADKHVDNDQDLNFCGIEWKVKQSNPSTTAIGPGDNYFYSDNVSVDTEGLHLKITQEEGDIWSSAELFTINSMPRGIYRFYLEGGSGTRLDQLDPQVVFSPFFYSDGTREIDIEFSNWLTSEHQGQGQIQYVVQPHGDDSLNRFGLNLDDSGDTGGKITCQIDWQDDRVIFQSWLGHSASPSDEGVLLSEPWIYEGNFIPESGDELKLHINLYLQSVSPNNDMPVHVIVKAIDHPASWEGWRVEQFGERNTLPSNVISNAQADPDFDNYPNLLEYALGSDPWKFDPDRQPKIGVYQDPESGENYLSYSFTRRKASPHPILDSQSGIHHTPFLDYYLKSKTDLANIDPGWIDEPVKLIGDPNDLFDGTETVTYRTENAVDEAPRKFLKLQVETRTP